MAEGTPSRLVGSLEHKKHAGPTSRDNRCEPTTTLLTPGSSPPPPSLPACLPLQGDEYASEIDPEKLREITEEFFNSVRKGEHRALESISQEPHPNPICRSC